MHKTDIQEHKTHTDSQTRNGHIQRHAEGLIEGTRDSHTDLQEHTIETHNHLYTQDIQGPTTSCQYDKYTKTLPYGQLQHIHHHTRGKERD
jgi:hypothetical protein